MKYSDKNDQKKIMLIAISNKLLVLLSLKTQFFTNNGSGLACKRFCHRKLMNLKLVVLKVGDITADNGHADIPSTCRRQLTMC